MEDELKGLLTFNLQWKKHFVWKPVYGDQALTIDDVARLRRTLNVDISEWLLEHDITYRIKWLPLIEHNKYDAQIIFENDADMILFIMRWG